MWPLTQILVDVMGSVSGRAFSLLRLAAALTLLGGLGCSEGQVGLGRSDAGARDLGADSGLRDADGSVPSDDTGPVDVRDLGVYELGAPDFGPDVGPDGGPVDMGSPTVGYRVTEGEAAYTPPELNDPGQALLLLPAGNTAERTATFQLPFAFEMFGRLYPQGTDVSVSTNGPIVFGSQSAAVGGPESLPVAGLTGPLLVPFWDQTSSPRVVIGLAQTADTFDVTYRNFGDGAVYETDFNVRFFRAGNRIEIMFFSDSSPASSPIGVSNGDRAFVASCSPACPRRAGDVVNFYPDNVQQVGADLAPAALVSPLVTLLRTDQALTIPDVVFENRGTRGRSSLEVAVLIGPPGGRFELPGAIRFNQVVGSPIRPQGSHTISFGSAVAIMLPGVGQYRVGMWLVEADDLDRSNDLLELGVVTVSDNPPGPPCVVTTTQLPPASPSSIYMAQLSATGCPDPTWSVQPALPPGIGLVPGTGQLFGRAGGFSSGDYTFTASSPNHPSGSRVLRFVVQ